MPNKVVLNLKGDRFKFTSNQRLYITIISFLVIAFVLLFLAFPPYGLDEKTNEAVRITFADNMMEAHGKVIDLFNKEHKGKIEVVPIDLPFSKFSTNERKELLARYFRSKSDRIDVFSVDQIWVPRFAIWCVPLANYFPNEDISYLISSATRSCYYNKNLVAAPLYLDIAVMFYRNDLLHALPDANYWSGKLANSITWEDFFKLHVQMRNEAGPFFIYQANDFEGLVCFYTELMANLHKQIFEKDSVQLDTPEAEKALQFLVDMTRKFNISPGEVTRFREDDSYQYYAENNGFFLRAWPGFIRNEYLREKYPRVFANCTVAPLPHLSGSAPAYVFGGWNLMISKFSTKIPEAVEFVRFLMGKESQEIMYEDGGYLPTNTLVYSDTAFVLKHPELKFYENLFRYGVYRPFTEEYTRISDILSYYMNLAIKGELSSGDALRSATREIKSRGILIK